MLIQITALASAQTCRAALTGPDRFAALRICVQDNDRDAAGQLMYELGAPFAAASWVKSPPLAWRADQVSKRIRWSRMGLYSDPVRRYEDADLALSQLKTLLEETRAQSPVDRPMERRLRLDRISALHSHGMCREVIDESKVLEAESPLPPYIHQALGDCLLELRQPDDARKRYAEVLRTDPANRPARMGFAYAALDQEDVPAAYAVIDQMAAENPQRFVRRKKDGPLEASEEWLDGQTAGAIFRLYADQPAEADQRLRPLINGAPGLAYLRGDSAKIAAARSRPRWADQEIRIATRLAPDAFGLQTELANSSLRRRRWTDAEERYRALSAQRPDDGAVLRLGRDLATEKTFLLETALSVTHEEGGNASAPGSNLTTGLKLYTPPLGERWRVIGAADRATAEPVEGKITRNRFGGGVDFRAPDLTIEAMGWANTGTLNSGSAGTWAYWKPSDAWGLSASYDYFSDDVPLRALFYNTRGNAIGGGVDFQANESQSLLISAKSMNFTDGNDRMSLRLAGAQTLVQRPGLSVAMLPELYGSRNTATDVPYFNPSKDAAAQIGFNADQRLWRRYQLVFSHSLNVGGGLYAQEHFSPNGIWNIRYAQSFRKDPLTALNWSLEINQRIYDGDSVRNLTGSLGWTQRF
jgi:biofilm PGA synthesis protein PgaA